jgi:hypothetical protein
MLADATIPNQIFILFRKFLSSDPEVYDQFLADPCRKPVLLKKLIEYWTNNPRKTGIQIRVFLLPKQRQWSVGLPLIFNLG